MAIAAMTTIASHNRLGLAPGMRLSNMADTPHASSSGSASQHKMLIADAAAPQGS
jgi:hypothetical protein